MNTLAHPNAFIPRRIATARRLPHQAAFWGVAAAFFALTAIATAPSALYGIYAQRDHLAPITLTVVYAVYAVGVNLTFVVLLTGLLFGIAVVARSPETRDLVRPLAPYRPQRMRAPAHARGQFIAATTGGFLSFAVAGLLAGLAPLLLGLVVLVASAWTTPASLPLFLIGSAVAGLGGGAVIGGSLRTVIATAGPEDRAGSLATYFTVSYIGISLPVLGAGIALQYLSFRVTLLIFAGVVALGILAAAPRLIRR
jgi:hypothetical protein